MNLMIALFPENEDFHTMAALRLVISTALKPYGGSGTSAHNLKILKQIEKQISFWCIKLEFEWKQIFKHKKIVDYMHH